MAMGSASELEYQLLLSKDLGFIDKEKHTYLSNEVQHVKRMLSGLIRNLAANRESRSPSDGG